MVENDTGKTKPLYEKTLLFFEKIISKCKCNS